MTNDVDVGTFGPGTAGPTASRSGVMQTFTWGGSRHRYLRAFGRNPLLRASDRIEAVVVLAMLVVTVLAVPVVAAVGTAVHESRARFYAEQAQSSHRVEATAAGDSAAVVRPNSISFVVRARWRVDGRDHIDRVPSDSRVRAGEPLPLWVDEHGNRVGAPPPASRADGDAVAVAVLLWLAVVAVAAGLASALRADLDRKRAARWEREIRDTDSTGGGGRRDHGGKGADR